MNVLTSLSFQIVELEWFIENYEKGQIELEGILSRQIYSNDKNGLCYSKFDNPSTSKSIFIKASNQSNKEKVNKVQHFHHHPKKIFFQKLSCS